VLGPVYRAQGTDHDAEVAVKVFRLDLTPEQAVVLAVALGRLRTRLPDHPNVVTCLAAGLDGSSAWLAHQYVAADALDTRLRRRAAGGLRHVLPWLRQVAAALDAAAQVGVHHGALHPRDVLLLTTGEVSVTGIGVADAILEAGGVPPVRRPYTAPERAADPRRPATAAADIFALGAMAVEAITGRRPIGSGATAVGFVSGVSEGVDPDACRRVLARALAEAPADRYPSAAAFADDLARAIGERAPSARPAPKLPLADPVDHASEASPGERRRPRSRGLSGQASHPAGSGLDSRRAAHDEEPPATVSQDTPAGVLGATGLPAAATGDFDPTLEGPEVAGPEHDALALQDDETVAVEETPHRAAGRDDAGSETPASGDLPLLRLSAEHDEGPPFTDIHRDVDRENGEPRSYGGVSAPPPGDRGSPAGERLAWDAPGAAPGASEPRLFSLEGAGASRGSWPTPRVVQALGATLALGLAIGLLGGYALWGRHATSGSAVDSASPAAGGAAGPPREGYTEEPILEAEPTTPTAAPAGARAATPERPLTPSSLPADGRLVVRSEPPGAQVTIDGRVRGVTPVTLDAIAAGTYEVGVSRSGYRPETRRVRVSQGGADAQLTVTLRPADRPAAAARTEPSGGAVPPSAQPASIEVVSRPPGARVYVDGRLVGTTPWRSAEVRPGSRVVRLELDGYAPWATTVDLEPGGARRLAASLDLRTSR
jgi:hypothetical protein